jgi:hypothetical protein
VSDTLFSASLKLAKILGAVIESEASGGSQTTLSDDQLQEVDDIYTYGTLWVKDGDLLNTHLVVTNFVGSGGIFYFAEQAASIADGDKYAAATDKWPFSDLLQALNSALQQIPILKENSALTTVVDQVEYTLPTGVGDLVKVEIARDADQPRGWQVMKGWREIAGSLKFRDEDAPRVADDTLRLTYRGFNAELTADADVVDTRINTNRLIWTAAKELWRRRFGRTEESNAGTFWQEAVANERSWRGRAPTDAELASAPTLESDWLAASDNEVQSW